MSKSLVLPQHHPLPPRLSKQGPRLLPALPFPARGGLADQPEELPGEKQQDDFASGSLDEPRKEVNTGRSKAWKGLESRAQGILPTPAARPGRMMRDSDNDSN